jgi:hypothetical protein
LISLKAHFPALVMGLLFLNLTGMAAGAGWLAVLSQWPVIGLGVTVLIFSPYILPILMVPAGIFAHLAAAHESQGRTGRSKKLYVCSLLYLVAFVSLWSAGIFVYILTNVQAGTSPAAVLIWANSTAMAPLFLWAVRDRSNAFIAALVIEAQVTMLILLGGALTPLAAQLSHPFWDSLAIYAVLMAVFVFGQYFYDSKTAKNQQ